MPGMIDFPLSIVVAVCRSSATNKFGFVRSQEY